MKFPSIHDYDDYRKFLTDFYALNKKKDSPTSHRYLAQKLNWPISYFNEVVKGRKNLTVTRALEFSKFAKMDNVDTEKLIYLTFLDNENETVKGYFKGVIKDELNVDFYAENPREKSNPTPEHYTQIPVELYQDVSYIAIQAVLAWANGTMTAKEISKVMYSFPELQIEKNLIKKLNILEKHKIIISSPTEEGTTYEVVKNHLFYTVKNNETEFFAKYAENFIRLCKLQRKIGWLHSGFILVPRNKLKEAEKKILQLNNWMMSLSDELELESIRDKRKDALVFQFDLNLLSILDPNALNIPSFKAWMENDKPNE